MNQKFWTYEKSIRPFGSRAFGTMVIPEGCIVSMKTDIIDNICSRYDGLDSLAWFLDAEQYLTYITL